MVPKSNIILLVFSFYLISLLSFEFLFFEFLFFSYDNLVSPISRLLVLIGIKTKIINMESRPRKPLQPRMENSNTSVPIPENEEVKTHSSCAEPNQNTWSALTYEVVGTGVSVQVTSNMTILHLVDFICKEIMHCREWEHMWNVDR